MNEMKKIAMLLSLAMILVMLAVPALAVDFTPSVENKPAPEIVIMTDKTGAPVAAIIYNAQGEEVIGVPVGELIVTPVAEADGAEAEISDALKKAYAQIQAAGSVADLVPNIEQILSQFGIDAKASDLVVRDLFDVSVFGTYKEYLEQGDNTVTIRFNLNLDPKVSLLVLHNYSGSDWEVISKDRVKRNADGSVDVTFSSLSPVAFVVDGSEVPVDPNGPNSPQTGSNGLPVAWICVAVLGCVAVVGGAMLRKKQA